MAIYIKNKVDHNQAVILITGFNKNSINRCQILIDELKNINVVTVDLSVDEHAEQYAALESESQDPFIEKKRLKTKYDLFERCAYRLAQKIIEFIEQHKFKSVWYIGLSAGGGLYNCMFRQLMCHSFSTGMICVAPVYIPGHYGTMTQKYHLIWDLQDQSVKYDTYKVAILSEAIHCDFAIILTENQGHRIGKKATEYIKRVLGTDDTKTTIVKQLPV